MEDLIAVNKKPEKEDFFESESLDKLYAALAKAQLEMLPAKTTKGPSDIHALIYSKRLTFD